MTLDRRAEASMPGYGRLEMGDPDVLSRAWLAASIYEREVAAALLVGRWRELYG